MATKSKKPKAADPVKPNPAELKLDNRLLRPGDEQVFLQLGDVEGEAKLHETIVARGLSRPEVGAATAMRYYGGDKMNINALVDELAEQNAAVQRGDLSRPEEMLMAQAHTLDAMFGNLACRAKVNLDAGCVDAAEILMRLALKAQAQTARTIEVLGGLKNPRSVAFVQQANIAHGPQQVNNALGRAGEGENLPSKLSGDGNELLPDTRASALACRVDHAVEAVGKVYRAEDAGGQGQGGPERL